MQETDHSEPAMHALPRPCLPLALLVLAACSSKDDGHATAPVSAAAPVQPRAAGNAPAAVVTRDEPECTNEPRTVENDKRPRCVMVGDLQVPHAYRVVGGGGDPVDHVVCDIGDRFVLDGKMFGVAFSGGVDGTWTFVRTPKIPGLGWKAGGRYHIEFPDGPAGPGTMTTQGGGTTTAGAISRDTAGGEHFTLTPVEACKQ
jgi:hypothetical protein